jgi:type IV secretion system protein TrbB
MAAILAAQNDDDDETRIQPSEARSSRHRLIRKLQATLGETICRALDDTSVVEVMVNPDGRLFIERLDHGMEMLAPLNPGAAEIIVGCVAHALQAEVDADRPIISGELPIGGHRFEGLLPPVVAAPSFTISRRTSRLIKLEDYAGQGAMTAAQVGVIRQAILARMNIVICGGTGSGKTTLANAVIAEMVATSAQERIVILEDTAEIRCTAENAVALHTSDTVDMARLLKSTMRLRPDRIIVGEVRDGAALTLLKAWNTGHPGGVTTIHSNSALSALRRLEQLTAEASHQPMQAVIGEAVQLVVSIERAGRGRRVRDVMSVTGFDGAQYQTSHCLQSDENSHAA